jgi:hypothetical protein
MPHDKKFSLEQMQQWMQSTLVSPGKIIVPASEKVETEELINSSKKLSAQQHLNIYRQSYIARLRECMKNQFSGLAYALGEELFQSFADDYLATHPSESYTLNNLGKRFPDFLQSTRPDAGQEIKEDWPDFMIELARFEFNLSVIFDEDAEEKNSEIPSTTPDAELALLPVFHLFHHSFPICNYYLEFISKKDPQLPFPKESHCAVIRKNYRLGLYELKPAQFIFLSHVKEGKSIEESLDLTAKAFQFDPQKKDELWMEWRKNFVACGFFVLRK